MKNPWIICYKIIIYQFWISSKFEIILAYISKIFFMLLLVIFSWRIALWNNVLVIVYLLVFSVWVFPDWSGKNQTNVTGAENPLKQNAFKNSCTGNDCLFQIFIFNVSIYSFQGSEIQGIPASIIRLISFLCFSTFRTFGVISLKLNLWRLSNSLYFYFKLCNINLSFARKFFWVAK